MYIELEKNYQILNKYIHFELYNGKKLYDNKSYMYDYGVGLKKYRNVFVKILNNNFLIKGKPQETLFVCAKEIYDKNEIKNLAKYCSCEHCSTKWYQLNKIFPFLYKSHTINCLKDPNSVPDLDNIARAREIMSIENRNQKIRDASKKYRF